MPAPERTQVFISYSHMDLKWLKRLQTMLAPLTRNDTIILWDDTRIRAGARWRDEIQKALDAAKVAVLLVSPHFLASDFITRDELPPLLSAAEKGSLTILWVAVSASLYKKPAIADYQAANNPKRPLDSLRPATLNQWLVEIAEMIEKAASHPTIQAQDAAAEPTPESTRVNAPPPEKPFEPEMILIPAGEFLMGSDPQQDEAAYDAEQPQHRLYLPDYYLAKTPVTNAQYLAFVQETHDTPPRHWTEGRPPRGKEDHPVVEVSWYDAMEYCRWLSRAAGKSYSLSSEAEWEKGARGIDGRIYPWGDGWDTNQSNSKEGGQEDTTPVEAYPQGTSPYGVLDMAGNVWEWTRSLWGRDVSNIDFRYPYNPEDGRENLHAPKNASRIARGGAFWGSPSDVRCALRYCMEPDSQSHYCGFRVVMHP
jgi:formylglycine-generating enzyme required for sulfatase activity